MAGGSAYVNSAQGVASETKGGATVYYTRTPSGKLVSQRTPTATYYYLFDGQGSVIGLVDAGGTVVASYSYDPYGQTVVKTGSAADGNPWRYTGAYLDATGLYKMGERYYDAARGRFTQLDPLGSGYIYANDNPVNFIDPTGLAGIDPENDPGTTEFPVGDTVGFGVADVRVNLGGVDQAPSIDVFVVVASFDPTALLTSAYAEIRDRFTGALVDYIPLTPQSVAGPFYVGEGSWTKPDTLPGGDYTVVVRGAIQFRSGLERFS